MRIHPINIVFTGNNLNKTVENKENNRCKTYAAIVGLALTGVAIGGHVLFRKKTSKPSAYIEQLAKDLSQELNLKIKPSQLKSVMNKEEFLSAVSKLKEENYIASTENIKKGIFKADLHTHTTYSDGKITVEELLNQAASYGDKLNKITSDKFIFAITDHDGINGVKKALEIIVQNPDKYKNVRFIPAAELSFPIHCEKDSAKFNKTGNSVEIAEVLAYGINPFSKNTKEFFDKLYYKRKDTLKNAIKNANRDLKGYSFSEKEFSDNFLKNSPNLCMMNLHWKIFDYLNIKICLQDVARAHNLNEEELLKGFIDYCSNNNIKHLPQNLEVYLKTKNLAPQKNVYRQEVWNFISDYTFKYENGNIFTRTENKFEDIIKYIEREDAILGFAHPAFTTQNYKPENAKSALQELLKKSNGRILLAEKYHQAYPYPTEITPDDVSYCNKIIDDLKLVNIGGRDNHSGNFTNF